MTLHRHVLVTGGAGYIGSHACVVLQRAGYKVTLFDSLINSRRDVVDRIRLITGRTPELIVGDVRDTAFLTRTLQTGSTDAVMHFAGLKAVGESMASPLLYYDVNVNGSLSLCRAMADTGVKRLIFSSSATVYGTPPSVPVREDSPTKPENNYGRTKLMVEQMLSDLNRSDPTWSIACLRYFNPVGADESGLIGELPLGTPNNLMPYIAQVAAGRQETLNIYGNDYPTPDGTGIRDYIHVVDLAEGHLAALRHLESHGGLFMLNLGTGQPCSVLQMVKTFEHVTGKRIPCRVLGRRPGDIAEYWADSSAAGQLFSWRATRDRDAMCRDTWRWQQYATACLQY